METSRLIGAFKRLWRGSWSPRLEHIIFASAATLVECENASLLGILLVAARFRWVLTQVRDPFLAAEFPRAQFYLALFCFLISLSPPLPPSGGEQRLPDFPTSLTQAFATFLASGLQLLDAVYLL